VIDTGQHRGSERDAEAEEWEPLDTAVLIETPEQVRFRYMLAGPSRRLAAYIVDTLVRSAALAVVGFAAFLGGLDPQSTVSGMATGVVLLFAFVLEWGYFVLFETLWEGQSPGKRVLRLRVVSASGRPLGFVDSVLRNVLRAADFLPAFYALGGAVLSSDARFRRLGDFVGGTLVVAEDPRKVEALLTRLAPPTQDELTLLPPEAALLPAEVEAIELYLRRRQGLPEERSKELAELAAQTIARRLKVRYRSSQRLLEVLYLRATGAPRVAP
jgi:uncharacterized RDD family membrane protein YckC